MERNPDNSAPDGGLWLSLADLARERGVSRQAIAERVDRLVARGHLTVRRAGRTRLVNLAEFLVAIDEAGDVARELAAADRADEAPGGDEPRNPAYRDAQTREKQLSADLKEIELRQKLGELVEVADLTRAVEAIGETIVRVVERIPIRAEDVAAAVGSEGAHGARRMLKEIARTLREEIADALASLKAPETPAAEN